MFVWNFLLFAFVTFGFQLESLALIEIESASEKSPVSIILLLEQNNDFHPKSLEKKNLGSLVLNSLISNAAESQKELLEFLNALDYVVRVESLYVANAIMIDVISSNIVSDLSPFKSQIKMIESNKQFQAEFPSPENLEETLKFQKNHANPANIDSNISSKIQWNIKWIKAPQVWNMSYLGTNLIYANADTGVKFTHEALIENYYGTQKDGTFDHNYAWFDGTSAKTKIPSDDQGHGTHTTSTAVGNDGYGVAPKAKWIACRNMINGLGTPESYLKCLQFFLAPTDLSGKNPNPDLRPVAVGNSYGCPKSEGCASNTFSVAVKNLRFAGIFMAVSNGNEGPMCSTVTAPPAFEPEVFSVGALSYMSNSIAFYSSKGPSYHLGKSNPVMKPDISAPGSYVKAAFIGATDDQYAVLSGTSMASPHVGGAVLLITEACPCLARDVDALENVIQDSALGIKSGNFACGDDTSSSIPNNIYGYGSMNVYEAIQLCKQICDEMYN